MDTSSKHKNLNQNNQAKPTSLDLDKWPNKMKFVGAFYPAAMEYWFIQQHMEKSPRTELYIRPQKTSLKFKK